MSEANNVLSGIRVIDCGTYIAAPAAAVVLSDFGADVIKIERPPFGDPYRYLSLVPGMPVSPLLYCWILEGRNKKSLALDLNDPAARAVLLKLVATADVFITNYQQPLVRKFRIGYEDLAPLNDRLIYAYLSGYGLAGDDAEQPGYDVTAYWARSGLMSSMHNADSEPAQSSPGFGDHPTSMALFGGIMLGLYRRERTGQGMNLTTSLMANGVWANSCAIQGALVGATFLPKWTRATTVNPIVNHYVTRDLQRFLTAEVRPLGMGRRSPLRHARTSAHQLARTGGPDRRGHRRERHGGMEGDFSSERCNLGARAQERASALRSADAGQRLVPGSGAGSANGRQSAGRRGRRQSEATQGARRG